MQFCDDCKEPAARRVLAAQDGQTHSKHYCYVHAIEAGVLEIPLSQVESTAAGCGYSVNAVIFVLESLMRAGLINEVDTTGRAYVTAAPPKSALQVCAAVSKAATDRFHEQAGLVLDHWKLTCGKNLGAILSGLVRVGGLLQAGAEEEKLLAELATVGAPLVTQV
jgi:hypothetical protein